MSIYYQDEQIRRPRLGARPDQGDKMNTIEDFENAPIGATATRADGSRAIKAHCTKRPWFLISGAYVNDEKMVQWGYTLDPAPVPTTAREALDLAWDLAHPVKEGQVIPEGTRYFSASNSGVKEYIAHYDVGITPVLVPTIRTFDPLPEPEPDWLDAPAVLAHTDNDHTRRVWAAGVEDRWASTSHTYTRKWRDLRDVTPLYPKETK